MPVRPPTPTIGYSCSLDRVALTEGFLEALAFLLEESETSMLWSVRRKLLRALRQRGLLGTLQLALRAAWERVAKRETRRRNMASDLAFDYEYGTETAGCLSSASFDVPGWEHAMPYQGIEPDEFRRSMGAVGQDSLVGRTFIDFGAGKGRALILASEYPFRRIIGAELAPQLVEVCRKNLSTFRSPRQTCRSLEIIHADVSTFPLPDEPTILYMYNPFDAEVMARVAENVRRSLAENPRPFVVVYGTPRHTEPWERFLKRRSSPSGVAIFEA
jgi:predicted RNA methylase